jgi:hypothetical protein
MAIGTEELKVVISAVDRASDTLKKIGGVAVAGFAAATAAVGSFAMASIKAFAEAEKEMTVANQAIENALKGNTKELENVQKAMAATGQAAIKLGFDDEAASVAFAKLFQVTKNVKQSQEEVKLAMDLAAFSGRDLESAAKALTMVHAGGTRVLKEFGIEVKDGTTSMDALALVQEKVKGSAEAMANTTAGRLEVLNQSWTNLKENVGATLAEAITPFITTLTDWAQKPETQQKLQEIAAGLARFIKEMTPIIQAMLPAFITLLDLAGKTIIKVSTFLFKDLPDAIATAIVWIEKIIGKITDFIQKIENALLKLKELVTTGTYSSSGASLNPFSPSFKLPGFAEGGIVPGPLGMPQLAVVHGGETVVPNGRFGGVVINITGNSFLDYDAPKKMADKIMDELKLNLRI